MKSIDQCLKVRKSDLVMKEDYPLKGDTGKAQFDLEKDVIETLKKMSEYTKLSESEMVNTAVKRFIATHMDFLPRKSK